MVIVIEKDGNYYLQVFSNECKHIDWNETRYITDDFLSDDSYKKIEKD